MFYHCFLCLTLCCVEIVKTLGGTNSMNKCRTQLFWILKIILVDFNYLYSVQCTLRKYNVNILTFLILIETWGVNLNHCVLTQTTLKSEQISFAFNFLHFNNKSLEFCLLSLFWYFRGNSLYFSFIKYYICWKEKQRY